MSGKLEDLRGRFVAGWGRREEKVPDAFNFLVLSSIFCYYWTDVEVFGFLTIEYETVLNF